MGLIKDQLATKENNRMKKLEGYRKKLKKYGNYNMNCPYCCNALSNNDVKKEQCVHCGYILKWNNL